VNQSQATGFNETTKLEPTHHEVFPTGQALAAWCGVSIAGFVSLLLALTSVYIFSPGLQVNDIADHDLLAPLSTSIIDGTATEKAMDMARQTIVPVFQVDRSRDQASFNAVKASLARIALFQKAGLTPRNATNSQKGTAERPKTKGKAGARSKGKTPASSAAPSAAATKSVDSVSTKLKGEVLLNLVLAPEDIYRLELKSLDAPSQAYIKGLRSALAGLRIDPNPSPLTRVELRAALTLDPSAAHSSEFQKDLLATAARLIGKFSRYPVADKGDWEGIAAEFLPETMSAGEIEIAAPILAYNLEPNLVIDHISTRSKAEEVVKTVQPVMREVKEGEVIVPRGSIITRDKLGILQALGITHINRWPFILSIAISLIAAITLVALFLYTYEPKHFFAINSVAMMYTTVVVATAVASLLGHNYPSFVPVPAAALILTIFFGHRVAVVLTLPLIMLIAVDRLVDLHHIFALLLASGAAIWTYSRQRTAVIATAISVAVAQVVGDLAASAAVQSITSWPMLGRQAGLDFMGGISSAILAIGSLPFLENMFGLITPFRLAELTDANQPLLRRLEENAPGTYQHSLAVANLAEAGAKAIAADPNMVRAGALYHDIGKMVRPKFFIENQLGDTNPHDSMAPEDSRARVLAHVTDGIALAQKYSLPKAIQDFIPMHQGTTLMAYFFHKACLRDGADKVDANFYRYPGPKPNTKETAIVMLADVSEAVTHSMQNPSNEEVEEALEKVFQNRWDDGQFTDAGLSYEELHKVKNGFCRVWRTLHHERLKYPATQTGKMPIPPDSSFKPDEKDNSGTEVDPASVAEC
jgi:cyclic-di-AMP phosphodiesterase PgpH